MLNRIKNHTLVRTFRELEGNPKWSICAEPLWFIPYSLFLPFQSLYMSKLGLSSSEIGDTISIGFFLQMFFALFGGIITDKMGRRLATVIFDTVSWTVPCLIWAFSQNYWWFMAAAAVNASFQITNISWYCLFIEDCPPKHVTNAFTLTQLCGTLSVFFAPIAVWLIGKYSVVPVVRCIYLFSAVSMTVKFLLLYHFGGETEMGKKRKEETRGVSFFRLFVGYKDVFLKILHSKKMIFVVLFMALSNISLIATNNFFSLYITERLHLSDEIVAVFPVIRTVIMILFVIGLQNLINRLRMKVSILFGFLIYILSHAILLLAPEKSIFCVLLYTLLEASAYAIIIPRKEALMALYVDLKERSRIFALYNTCMIAISIPFGRLVGSLFDWSPVYPFLFHIGIFLLSSLLILFSRDLGRLEEDIEEDRVDAGSEDAAVSV